MLPFKKAGGGYLNNVDGVILSVEFDDSLTGTSGKGDDAANWRKLSMKLTVKVDGADEPAVTFLNGGFIYDEAASFDGAVISGVDECPIKEDTEIAGFIGSMVENGLAEEEVGAGLDYSFLEGLRVRFVSVKDEARNAKQGKRKDKKTGKEYDHEQRRVSKVYGREDVKKAAKGGAAKKTSAPKAAPKATAAAKPAADTSVADTALLTIVGAAKDGTVKQDAIGGLFIKYALKNNIGADDREPVRNMLMSDEYLSDAAERGIITFEPKGGKGIIKATE